MPGRATAEVIFIAVMMILILILSVTAVYFFFKTYKKEMKAKEEAWKEKEDAEDAK